MFKNNKKNLLILNLNRYYILFQRKKTIYYYFYFSIFTFNWFYISYKVIKLLYKIYINKNLEYINIEVEDRGIY